MTFTLAAFMMVYLKKQNQRRDEVDAGREEYTEEEYIKCTLTLCIEASKSDETATICRSRHGQRGAIFPIYIVNDCSLYIQC